jgi:hypothetical protein
MPFFFAFAWLNAIQAVSLPHILKADWLMIGALFMFV